MPLNFPQTGYSPTLLTNQSGISISIGTTAGTMHAVGNSFTIPRPGLLKIFVGGYYSASTETFYFHVYVTRNGKTFSTPSSTSTQNGTALTSNSEDQISFVPNLATCSIEVPVIANDTIQVYVESTGSYSGTVYVDSLVAILI
jgi:hypothetical protein